MEWLNSLGPTAGAVVVVLLFLKYIQNKDKSDESRNKENMKALSENTKAMKSVAEATKKQAKEAEIRNGHLAEIAVENKNSNFEQSKAILNAISEIKVQHVTTQTVDNQTIKRK